MKLNFEICKKCNYDCNKSFMNTRDKFVFYCGLGGRFIFESCIYNTDKLDFQDFNFFETTEMEWKEIERINILCYYHDGFNNCPYFLEHMVDQ